MKTQDFKSQLRKLVRFFERSRDRWKSEAKQLQVRIQSLEAELDRQEAVADQFAGGRCLLH